MANIPIANRKLFRNGFQRFQQGGMVEPMQPPMPMPQMSPQAPLMAPDAMMGDPNSAAMVEGAIADETATQVTNVQQDIDNAQNIDQLLKSFGTEETSEETVREDLAGIVGAEDAMNTPESVLTLVQPMLSMLDMDDEIATGGLGDLLPEPDVDDSLTAPTMPMLAENFNPVAGFRDGSVNTVGDDIKESYSLPLSPDYNFSIKEQQQGFYDSPITGEEIRMGTPFMNPLDLQLKGIDYDEVSKRAQQYYAGIEPYILARREETPSLQNRLAELKKQEKAAGFDIEVEGLDAIKERAEGAFPDVQTDLIQAEAIADAGMAMMNSKGKFVESILAAVPPLSQGFMTAAAARSARDFKIGQYALEARDTQIANAAKREATLLGKAIDQNISDDQTLDKFTDDVKRDSLEKARDDVKFETKTANNVAAAAHKQRNQGDSKTYITADGDTVEVYLYDDTVYDYEIGTRISRPEYEQTRNKGERLIPYTSADDLSRRRAGSSILSKGTTLSGGVTIPINQNNLQDLIDYGVITEDTGMGELGFRASAINVPAVSYKGNYYITSPDKNVPPLLVSRGKFSGTKPGKITDYAELKTNENNIKTFTSSIGGFGNEMSNFGAVGDFPDGFNFTIKDWIKYSKGDTSDLSGLPLDQINRHLPVEAAFITAPAAYNKNGLLQSGNPFVDKKLGKMKGLPDVRTMTEDQKITFRDQILRDADVLREAERVMNGISNAVGIAPQFKDFLTNKVSGLTFGRLREYLKSETVGADRAAITGLVRKLIRQRALSPRFALGEQTAIMAEMQGIGTRSDTELFDSMLESPERFQSVMTELLRGVQNSYNAKIGTLKNMDVYQLPLIPTGTSDNPYQLEIKGTRSFLMGQHKNALIEGTQLGLTPQQSTNAFFQNRFIKVPKKYLNELYKENGLKRRETITAKEPYKLVPLGEILPMMAQ